MKVGDYVRIKNEAGWSCIGKLENINDFREYKYCVDIQAEDFIFVDDEMIYKSSPNIMDLIEVGDYVNGEKVIALEKDIEKRNIYPSNIGAKIFTDYELQGNWYFGIQEKDIKSIVTKEQFESMEYRIGD